MPLPRRGAHNAANLGEPEIATLERHKRVADLYLRGKSQWQISQELGINQGNVSRHLEALRVEWRKSEALHIDAIQQRELAKVDTARAAIHPHG